MDILDQLHGAHWADASERLRLVNLAADEIERLREDAKKNAKYMLAIWRMRQTRGNEFMEAFDQAVKLYEDEQPAKATGEEVMDIVDDLRDLNSMHTPKEISDIGEKAADEIERLREEVEHLHKMTVKWSVLQVEGSQEIQRLREDAKKNAKYMLAFYRIRQTRGNEFMEAFDQAVRLYEDEQPAKATGEEVMDIVDDLRDLNSMHTPKEISDIGEKAADEIERLREEVEHLHKMTVKWSALQVEGSQENQRLREALQWAIKDCDAKTNHESIKRELLEALEGK